MGNTTFRASDRRYWATESWRHWECKIVAALGTPHGRRTYERPPDERTAVLEHVPHQGQKHQARDPRPLHPSPTRLPLPPPRQKPSRPPRHRPSQIQNRHLRPRLLLAPPPRLQKLHYP